MNPAASSQGHIGRAWRRIGALLLTLLAAPVLGAPLTVTPASLPTPVSGVAYNVTITPGGGAAPYHIALAAGLLPPGLTLSAGPNDATLSGTPGLAAAYAFTLAIGDSIGAETYLSARSMSLSAGSGANQSLATPGGGGPYTVSVLSGALPSGMAVGSDGILSGGANVPGTYDAVVRITDSLGNVDTTTLRIVVGSTPPGNVGAIPVFSPWAMLLLILGIMLMAAARWRSAR